MLKRKIEDALIAWKNKPEHKPLVIMGIRQCGKTYISQHFAEQNYKNVVYMNFIKQPERIKAFAQSKDVGSILLNLSAQIRGVKFIPGETCLIFDEIQEVPKALSSLKYFCENAPEYAIVAAGSLLGVAMHKGTSFPVGKVDFMDLYPLNFQEFLCALGEERFADWGYPDDQYLRFQIQGSSARVLLCRWYAGSGPVLCE